MPNCVVQDSVSIGLIYGCTDPSQSNYDPLTTIDDGSCIPFIYGCMDSLAMNYNANANSDDGSCLYAGCTRPIS